MIVKTRGKDEKTITLFVIVGLLLSGVMVNTEVSCLQAKSDTKKDVSNIIWFGIGCLLNWIWVLIGYVAFSPRPSSRLLGKSPAYVATYTDCYRERARNIQTK